MSEASWSFDRIGIPILMASIIGCSTITTGESKEVTTERETLSPVLQETLIKSAKEKSKGYGLVTEGCTTKLLQEKGLWAVEFHPTNPNQLGGGGKVWFKIDGETITFRKIELWE